MRHRFPILRGWVARRQAAAEQLEQAAIDACLFDCASETEREFVREVLRERAANQAARAVR